MAHKPIREYNATVKERQHLFSQAGRLAIAAAKAAALPLTYVSGTDIIQETADGTKEVIGSVHPRITVVKRKIKIPKE